MPERVIHKARSEFQSILLTKEDNGNVHLTLDGFWQFHSNEEYIFHEALTDVPMVMAPSVRRVLILGGGDGLALRNVLRYEGVLKAVLCELDPLVIEMTREVPEMRALSEDSLRDPRATVLVQDALVLLRETDDVFDVVICDFPAWTRPEQEGLFSAEFFELLQRVCHEETVIGVQVSQDPETFWPIRDGIEKTFGWVKPLLVDQAPESTEDGSWADFIITSRVERRPLRALPDGVRFLTLDKIDRLTIKNCSGERFDTEEYRGEPDFS